MTHSSFQYCQKIVIFDGPKILLCKRQGETDYNNTFSFIGGKLEHADESFVDSMQREKNEELGPDFLIELFPLFSINTSFVKEDGTHMILPHYYARYLKGDISLSDEYSEYAWVSLRRLNFFQPTISNVPLIANQLARLSEIANPEDFLVI